MGIHILIAAKDQEVVQTISETLRKFGEEATIAGYTHSIENTIARIDTLKPDLVFMDVKLADGEAFEVLHQISVHPQIIFISENDQLLLKSLDFAAYRHLKKPIKTELLFKTLSDFIAAYPKEGPLTSEAKPTAHTSLHNSYDGKIGLRVQGRVIFVNTHTIIHCVSIAEGKATRIVLEEQQITDSRPLKTIEALLEPYGIVRIHKSYLINLRHIAEITRSKKYWTLKLQNNDEFTIPGKRVPAFKEQLQKHYIVY